MQIVHGREWPELEKRAGKKLIHKTLGCFFGTPGEKFAAYVDAVTAVGVDVQLLTPEQGRKRFPMFRFPDAIGVLDDHTAGVIAAAQTIRALTEICKEGGIEFLEHTKVLGIDVTATPIVIRTQKERITADKLIITAGAWVKELCPFLAPRLQVARQAVCYFRVDAPAEQLGPPNYPVWCFIDDDPEKYFYGLPQFDREGVKLARHIVVDREDDPNEIAGAVPEQEIEIVRRFLAEQMAWKVKELVATERCLYTCTDDEDFILDLHPQNENIAIGSACSGHGFKFGPLTGRILTDLALHGKTSIPEFEVIRDRFRC